MVNHSTCCSWRRSMFGSQHTHNNLRQSVTPVAGDPMPPVLRHQALMWGIDMTIKTTKILKVIKLAYAVWSKQSNDSNLTPKRLRTWLVLSPQGWLLWWSELHSDHLTLKRLTSWWFVSLQGWCLQCMCKTGRS